MDNSKINSFTDLNNSFATRLRSSSLKHFDVEMTPNRQTRASTRRSSTPRNNQSKAAKSVRNSQKSSSFDNDLINDVIASKSRKLSKPLVIEDDDGNELENTDVFAIMKRKNSPPKELNKPVSTTQIEKDFSPIRKTSEPTNLKNVLAVSNENLNKRKSLNANKNSSNIKPVEKEILSSVNKPSDILVEDDDSENTDVFAVMKKKNIPPNKSCKQIQKDSSQNTIGPANVLTVFNKNQAERSLNGRFKSKNKSSEQNFETTSPKSINEHHSDRNNQLQVALPSRNKSNMQLCIPTVPTSEMEVMNNRQMSSIQSYINRIDWNDLTHQKTCLKSIIEKLMEDSDGELVSYLFAKIIKEFQIMPNISIVHPIVRFNSQGVPYFEFFMQSPGSPLHITEAVKGVDIELLELSKVVYGYVFGAFEKMEPNQL